MLVFYADIYMTRNSGRSRIRDQLGQLLIPLTANDRKARPFINI